MTDTAQAEALIELIVRSIHLTEEQKESYLKDIFDGKMPEELEHTLDAFMARENHDLQAEMQELQDSLAAQEAILAKQSEGESESLAAIVKEHEEDTKKIKDECITYFNHIELETMRDTEKIVKTNKEDTEADAIRAMLKQKPSDTQSA